MVDMKYRFGENWKRHLDRMDERHLADAVRSLSGLFGGQSFSGKSFLDIGSGSGIHSVAAYRLGSERILSFDSDAESVECTLECRRREGNPRQWIVRQGSILDEAFVATLPISDIVYSWGVLHHTGAMYDAIRLAATRCAPGGLLMIGIYNRKGRLSDIMRNVKRSYCRAGPIGRHLIKWPYWILSQSYAIVRGKNPLVELRDYHEKRGMDYWTDLDDWLGGYPFEYATPDEVSGFVTPLGFDLESQKTGTSFAAVNEYLFRRREETAPR